MTDLPRFALAVRQPWAWAIIHAGKNIENRTQLAITKGRMGPGRIAILASRGMTQLEYQHAALFMGNIGVTCPAPADLVRGGIIGSVTVDRIVSTSPSPWWMGPRGLVLWKAEACEPVPAVGQLGYFEWKRSGGDLEKALPWMMPKPAPVQPLSRPVEPGASDLFVFGD